MIIDDNVTAYIKSNGSLIAEISGGSYDFVDTQRVESLIQQKEKESARSISNIGSKIWTNLLHLIGKRDKSVEADSLNPEEVDKIIEKLRGNDLLSLTLMMNQDFELVIGGEHSQEDDYAEFTPMKIRSKYLDLNLGIRAKFKISDFDIFSKHYMASNRCNVSTAMLAKEITPMIKSAIESVMLDVELKQATIPADILERIKQQINNETNASMYGVTLVNIVEVTLEEESLERMRALSRELYLSEQELDALSRSNDIKNRLNAQVDEQTILDARRESDRDRALMQINQDGLLSEAEMERFKMQLKLEKAIREARNEDEYQAVLSEIEANGFQRTQSLNIAKLRAAREIEDLNLERDRNIRVTQAETDVMQQRVKDDYDFEKQERIDKRTAQRADSAMEQLRKMKEMSRADKSHEHEMQMERERAANETMLRSMELKANMSPQQLMALAAEQNMDSAAAQKLAESFSAGLDMQQQKEFMESFNKMNQARIDDQVVNADRMERMMNRMMDMTSSMAGNIGREQESMKREYRDRLEHQESRMDATMDRSLDYTTKNNEIDKSAPKPTVTYMVDIEGMEHIEQTLPQVSLLIKKGKIEPETLIFSTATNDWIEASSYSELSRLLPTSANGTKSCPSCGVKNSAGDMFCDACGSKL